jgi:putative SOS response-associated peptidase YedK
MPAILQPSQYAAWLDPRARAADDALKLLQPYAGTDLEAYSVSALVNSPDNEGPECIAPQAPPPKRQLELL